MVSFFWDSEPRRTTGLTTFAAATLDEDDETSRDIALDCAKVLLGESSEGTIESIIEIIDEGEEYLGRWTSAHAKHYPEESHDILLPGHVDLVNCSNSAFTPDT